MLSLIVFNSSIGYAIILRIIFQQVESVLSKEYSSRINSAQHKDPGSIYVFEIKSYLIV